MPVWGGGLAGAFVLRRNNASEQPLYSPTAVGMAWIVGLHSVSETIPVLAPSHHVSPADRFPVGGPEQDVVAGRGLGGWRTARRRSAPSGGRGGWAGSVDGGGGDAGKGCGGGGDQEQGGDGQGHQQASQAGHGTPLRPGVFVRVAVWLGRQGQSAVPSRRGLRRWQASPALSLGPELDREV